MIVSDAPKLRKILDEVSNAMTRAEAERDYIKEALTEAADNFQIDKKVLRKLARTYHKQNYNEEVSTMETFSELYETVTK